MTKEEDDSDAIVTVGGVSCRKYEVPLGKEFVQDGRRYQGSVCPGTFGQALPEQRFRYGEQWYFKEKTGCAMRLDPNMPFGRPYFVRSSRTFHSSERVVILEIADRGPA